MAAHFLFPEGKPRSVLTNPVLDAIALLRGLANSPDPLPGDPSQLINAADLLRVATGHDPPSTAEVPLAQAWDACAIREQELLEYLADTWEGPPIVREKGAERLDRWRREKVRKRIGALRILLRPKGWR
jgi:hypothetical protein